jgi:hypothetical protein
MGTTIGTETGGLTVSYGDLYTFQLPNTKYNMDISWKKWFLPCGIENGRGIIPDYIVEPLIEDEAKSKDRVLKFAIDLIKQNK